MAAILAIDADALAVDPLWLVERLRDGHRQGIGAVERLLLEEPPNSLLTWVAWQPGAALGAKLAAVFPGNEGARRRAEHPLGHRAVRRAGRPAAGGDHRRELHPRQDRGQFRPRRRPAGPAGCGDAGGAGRRGAGGDADPLSARRAPFDPARRDLEPHAGEGPGAGRRPSPSPASRSAPSRMPRRRCGRPTSSPASPLRARRCCAAPG